jgi:hypothetical protein
MVERQWLRHEETGGYFHCPVDAVDEMRAKGWEPSDPPPPEVNPAIAEQLAWREQQQAETTKPRRGSSPKESDH